MWRSRKRRRYAVSPYLFLFASRGCVFAVSQIPRFHIPPYRYINDREVIRMLDYRQLLAMPTSDTALWWKSPSKGTSCYVEIGGTNVRGNPCNVYLTELIVTSATTRPILLTIINGTAPGTTLLGDFEICGTTTIFNPTFNARYPRSDAGTHLSIFAESMANGTVSMACGGFLL
jgi:hypothetical protein